MGLFNNIWGSNSENSSTETSVIIKEINSQRFEIYTSEIADGIVRAEVPVDIKKRCDLLKRKSNLSENEKEFLHENYRVNVYFKGLRHAYKRTDDLSTILLVI